MLQLLGSAVHLHGISGRECSTRGSCRCRGRHSSGRHRSSGDCTSRSNRLLHGRRRSRLGRRLLRCCRGRRHPLWGTCNDVGCCCAWGRRCHVSIGARLSSSGEESLIRGWLDRCRRQHPIRDGRRCSGSGSSDGGGSSRSCRLSFHGRGRLRTSRQGHQSMAETALWRCVR